MGLIHVTVGIKSLAQPSGSYEVGITIDPASRPLKRLPAIPLK